MIFKLALRNKMDLGVNSSIWAQRSAPKVTKPDRVLLLMDAAVQNKVDRFGIENKRHFLLV
jgi:hypothetical protein